ncbi:MAG: hypothetical protein Q9186_000099 [Xanthomendoza sp. 1 TL-2023]
MRAFTPALLFATTSIFAPLSSCAPPNSPNLALQQGPAPLHVPTCLDRPGGYDLFVCARLLSTLKNLDYYSFPKIWSELAAGDGHLPAVLFLSDKTQRRQCFLTLDLYEPGVPATAKERFSLKEEQNEFNNIYFECLKAKGLGGLNRIGYFGNVAAWLGPRLQRDNPSAAHFKNFRSITGNETEAKNVHMIDMAAFDDK